MHSQFPSSYLIRVLFTSAVLATVDGAEITTCVLPNVRNSDTASSCYCRSVDDAPWPQNSYSRTAPKPKNVSLNFTNNNNQIRPRISWAVHASYLKEIDGFFMEVMVEPNLYYFYNCSYHITKLGNQTKILMQQFEFEKCCKSLIEGNGFESGKQVAVKLHSLPMYLTEDNSYFVSVTNKVPDYSDNTGKGEKQKKRKGSKCQRGKKKKNNCHKRLTEESGFNQSNVHHSRDSHIMIAIVAILATFLFCLAVCTICGFCLFKRYFSVTRRVMKRRILLVGDGNDKSCIKLHNRLIETLKKCSFGEVEVVTNIRSVSEIAATGIVSWATENIRNSDVVLFVLYNTAQVKAPKHTEERRQDFQQKCSSIAITLGIAEVETVKSRFKQSKKKFVVLHTGKDSYENNLLSYCTHYLLRKDFKRILKHVLGSNYDRSVEIREDHDYLMKQIDESAESQRERSVRTPPGSVRNTTTVNSPVNNLDCSLIADPSSISSRNTLDQASLYHTENNPDSGFPSMECNSMV